MKKKILALLLASVVVVAFGLTGCGNQKGAKPAATEPTTGGSDMEETVSAEPETQVSSDTAILVVSFGTSFNDSRDITIGAIENAIEDAYPQYPVRRAFTAQIIIDKLAQRDNLDIDNVTEALDRAVADGIKNLIVQPTHLMDGLEYQDLIAELDTYKEDFDQIVIGQPLLTSDDDYARVIEAITEQTSQYDEEGTAIVFMGHGTEAESNHVYADLQQKIKDAGHDNYYIGTVEAEPSLDDVIAMLKEGSYTKVVLEPLMVVCGDHANNDMAGDEEDSWKSAITNAGYEVECLLHGLGENTKIQDIYVDHVQAAIDSLAK